MYPLRRTAPLFLWIIFLLSVCSCNKEVDHPSSTPIGIQFDHSILLSNPEIVEPFDNIWNINLWLTNNSGNDLSIDDQEILVFIVDGDHFTKVENIMENSFQECRILPGFDDLGQRGQLSFGVTIKLQIEKPTTIRIYSFGETKSGEKYGAFFDVELRE